MKLKQDVTAIILAFSFLAFSSVWEYGQVSSFADRLFINGAIWTGDDARPRAEALAVKGDRIMWVGSDEEALQYRGPATEVVDLRGHFACPGFNDAHLHFLALERVDLDGAADLQEVQERLRESASSRSGGPWITGRGWTYTMFPGNTPLKEHLDAITPDRPVFLTDRDGHAALANSTALRLAGINTDTEDPSDGQVVRDTAGEATGLLKEGAMDLVSRHIPPPPEEELYRTLRKRLDQAASFGLTSVQNASQINLPVWERVASEGQLKVRVYACLPFEKDPAEETLRDYRSKRTRYPGPLIKYGAIKGMLDGTIDSRTAALFEPYVGGGTGIAMWDQADLDRAVAVYDREGFQILLHAIGDRAVNMALNAYERASAVNGTSGRRHRVEHIELPLLSDLPRFRQLGVIASTQAIFANPDEATLGNFAIVLGPERSARADAFRLFDDAGAIQAFGSDWPVFSMETLKGIYAAVTRRTPEGTPPGGWYPQNRISAEAALRHFTVDSAYASHDEVQKGTLVAGKLADFVVLSEDILKPPAERILRTKVLLTVMGGRDTFRSPAF